MSDVTIIYCFSRNAFTDEEIVGAKRGNKNINAEKCVHANKLKGKRFSS